MRSILVISKREVTRLRSRFTGKTRIALFAIILLAAGIGYAMYLQDIGLNRSLYNVGVSRGTPTITDERFRSMVLEPSAGEQELERGKIDLYLDGDTIIYDEESDRSPYALEAIKEYLEKRELYDIAENYPIEQAFPLRIRIKHIKVDDEISGGTSDESFEDVLQDPAQSDATQSGTGTDQAVREHLDEFRTSGNLPEFEAEFVSDNEIIVPSLSRPPIPMAQVILAFIYVVPLFFVGVFFTSSFMEEKINRQLVILLSAPITPLQVIVGKMLPYIVYSILAIIAITLILDGDIILSLAIFIPVSFFIFSALLMVALMYRTFKDQTFFSILAAWILIAYLVTPAMFTGLSEISYFSPLTLAVEMYRDEPFGLLNYLLATIPLYLLFAVILFVGIRIFNEEYLMGFRPLHRKLAEAVNLVMDRRHLSLSVMLVSLMLIPIVLMIQFALIAVGINISTTTAFVIIFPLAIISEEIAKSCSVAVLLQNHAINSYRNVIKYSFFSALGFFLGEKLLLFLTLSVVSETMFVEAALGAGWLILPLLMHFATTSVVGLLSLKLGIRFYPLALITGVAIHTCYNLLALGGIIL